MINNKKISVIIPAYNEMNYIGETLENLKLDWLDELIVVNDGSTDKSRDIIKKFQVKLLDLADNHGKGRAVTEGILCSSGDIIVTVDADLGDSVVEIKKLIDPLINDDYEAAVGIMPVTGGGLGIVRKLADWGLKGITGKTMLAALSGQRAYRREILDYILPLENGFAMEMGINIDLIKNSIKFIEVECSFKHRVSRQDLTGYRHRIRQFADISRFLWRLKREKYVYKNKIRRA